MLKLKRKLRKATPSEKQGINPTEIGMGLKLFMKNNLLYIACFLTALSCQVSAKQRETLTKKQSNSDTFIKIKKGSEPGHDYDYEIQATLVTQQQYFNLMGENPSKYKEVNDCPEDHKVTTDGTLLCPSFPAVGDISFKDMAKYFRKLNEANSKDGYFYRLPTDLELYALSEYQPKDEMHLSNVNIYNEFRLENKYKAFRAVRVLKGAKIISEKERSWEDVFISGAPTDIGKYLDGGKSPECILFGKNSRSCFSHDQESAIFDAVKSTKQDLYIIVYKDSILKFKMGEKDQVLNLIKRGFEETGYAGVHLAVTPIKLATGVVVTVIGIVESPNELFNGNYGDRLRSGLGIMTKAGLDVIRDSVAIAQGLTAALSPIVLVPMSTVIGPAKDLIIGIKNHGK